MGRRKGVWCELHDNWFPKGCELCKPPAKKYDVKYKEAYYAKNKEWINRNKRKYYHQQKKKYGNKMKVFSSDEFNKLFGGFNESKQ